MSLDEAKQLLIDAGQILEAQGQGDLTRGHVSVRVPGDPGRFYMKPHSFGFDEISFANIVTCDLSGEKVDGGGRRHSEVYIHSEIYRARSDVGCVIHSHPIHAVAFSATGRALRPISQPGATFADGVPYFTDAIDLIRTPQLGAAVARALGARKAVLLRNHGVAVVGASVEEATILAILLEGACQIQLLAEAGGGIGETFDADRVRQLHDDITRPEQYAGNFEYLRRRVRRGRAA